MTEIKVARFIPRPIDEVFAAAQQVERFPDVLPDLDKVTILENDGAGHTVTKWEGTVSLGPLTRKIGWTERDTWDSASKTCTFELVEGDMKEFSGVWTFVEVGQTLLSATEQGTQTGVSAPPSDDPRSGTQVDMRVQFELGIPVLGPMINQMVDKLMTANCEDLLVALERLTA